MLGFLAAGGGAAVYGLEQLWDELVSNSIIQREQEIFFDWFSNLFSRKCDIQLSLEDIVKLFEEKMKKYDFSQMNTYSF